MEIDSELDRTRLQLFARADRGRAPLAVAVVGVLVALGGCVGTGLVVSGGAITTGAIIAGLVAVAVGLVVASVGGNRLFQADVELHVEVDPRRVRVRRVRMARDTDRLDLPLAELDRVWVKQNQLFFSGPDVHEWVGVYEFPADEVDALVQLLTERLDPEGAALDAPEALRTLRGRGSEPA